MIKNIGLSDKKLRVLFSIIIALLAIIFQVWWLFIITALLFITAFVGFCPLYALFKCNTNKESQSPAKAAPKPKSSPKAKALKSKAAKR